MKSPTYNHRIFFIEDEDERDQCQFVPVPLNGEAPRRCQKDGTYRIGLTIFLCGVHMPGVGRHPESKPVKVKAKTLPGQDGRDESGVSKNSLHGKLLAIFTANAGRVVAYRDIFLYLPQLSSRSTVHTIVSQLRKWTGSHILSVQGVGYKYLGCREDENNKGENHE